MAKRRKRQIDDESRFALWWQRTWGERESILRETFGPTLPDGYVTSFTWNKPLTFPGACALTFPPQLPKRPHWLYLSHGLTQPGEESECQPQSRSAYGWEFAILTSENSGWPLTALRDLLGYTRQIDHQPIDMGHRVPVWFKAGKQGEAEPVLGMCPALKFRPSANQVRALLFWLYLTSPSRFWTETGYFWILVATTITNAEWQMAKDTSSLHVLLLLCRAGIGQVSDLNRRTVTEDRRWAEEWERIRNKAVEEVEQELRSFEKTV
jgi:hypothetical protein